MPKWHHFLLHHHQLASAPLPNQVPVPATVNPVVIKTLDEPQKTERKRANSEWSQLVKKYGIPKKNTPKYDQLMKEYSEIKKNKIKVRSV